jgi:hypothetical protein
MTANMHAHQCRCGRPTRDAAYGCDTCGDQLARALGDCTWLDEQMEVTITRQQGIDYRRLGGSKGGKKDAERPLPGNWTASEARTHLRALLVSWTRLAHDESVRSSDPRDGLPDDNLPAISRWLLWRVDGLMLHEAAGDVVEEITSAVAHCHRLIDKHPERQYLGPCSACPEGRLYARPGSKQATCESCDVTVDADVVRKRLLEELDDRLCTAAEIARLSTYLGLQAGREQVRKRINQWNARGRIEAHPSFSDETTFQFGEVYGLLVAAEYAQKASA